MSICAHCGFEWNQTYQTHNCRKIDQSVPVSRADYDAMADQRDAFRGRVLKCETYLRPVVAALSSEISTLQELQRDLEAADTYDTCKAARLLEESIIELQRALALAREGLLP